MADELQPQSTPSAPSAPVVSSTPAPSQPTVTSTPAPSSDFDLVQWAGSQGVKIGEGGHFKDPSEFVSRWYADYAQRIKSEQQAQSRLAEFEEHRGDFEAYRAQKAAEAQKEQAAAKAREGFQWQKPPEYRPEWKPLEATMQRHPLTGEFITDRPEYAGIAKNLSAYHKWREEAQNRLLSDPASLVSEIVKPHLQTLQEQLTQQYQTQLQAAIAQYEAINQTRSQLARQEADIYELDAQGNRQYEPDGQGGMKEKLKPLGKAMYDLALEAREFGLSEPAAIQSYVKKNLDRMNLNGKQQAAVPAQASAPSPAEQQRDQKGRFIDKARVSRERGANGTPVDPPLARNLEELAMQCAADELRNAGSPN